MSTMQVCLSCFKHKGDFSVCPHCGWVDGSVPEQAFHLHPGTVLQERYLIGASVGFGGFGVTYKAWDVTLSNMVAIKEFFPAGLVSRVPGETQVVIFSGEKEEQYRHQLERFMDEARNMAKFDKCPNIVHVYDYFEANSTAYIVMEFLDGVTLKQYARDENRKPVPVEHELAMMVLDKVLTALEEIHAKNIIHRDVSPDNIFLTRDGGVKLLDFGAARLSAKDQSEETLMAIIKPGFAPPEQYRSRSQQGPFTDVYALGATMYRTLTGVTPDESVDRQINDELKRPSEYVKIDASLDKSIMKAMALRPELRFQTMQEFREAVFQNKKVDFPEDELRKRKQRNILLTALTAVAMVAVIIVIAMNTGRAPEVVDVFVNVKSDTITMMIPVGGTTDYNDEVLGSLATEMSTRLAETNRDSGFRINVDLRAVAAEDYANTLRAAQSSRSMPTLYCTDAFDPAEDAIPLEKVYQALNPDEYLFLGSYGEWFPGGLEIPLSFDFAVGYGSQAAADYFGAPLPAGEAMEMDLTSHGYWQVASGSYDSFFAVYGGMYPQQPDTGLTDRAAADLAAMAAGWSGAGEFSSLSLLEQEQVSYMLASSSDLSRLQTSLWTDLQVIPATYQGGSYGTFRDTWGISSQASENKQLAAVNYLLALLSDYGQQELFPPSGGRVPLNRTAYEAYRSENGDLPFPEESQIAFLGEGGRRFAEACRAVEERLVSGGASQEELRAIMAEAQP